MCLMTFAITARRTLQTMRLLIFEIVDQIPLYLKEIYAQIHTK
jgi:hypothetical protein